MRERDRLEKKFNKSRNPEDWRIVFKGNGSIITDQRGVAETLSNFFTSLGQTQQSGSGAKLNPYLSHVQH